MAALITFNIIGFTVLLGTCTALFTMLLKAWKCIDELEDQSDEEHE